MADTVHTVTPANLLWKRLRAGETITVTADADSSGQIGEDVHDSGVANYPLNRFRIVQAGATVTIGPCRRRLHIFVECFAGALIATHSQPKEAQ